MNDMNIDSVDLNLLKVLQALHEEGTAGRAAIRLGVTQSAVSAALGRLRALYGDPLFERTGRGLRPTPKAEELRPLIAEALQKLRQSLALAQPGGASLAGRTVVLGLSDDRTCDCAGIDRIANEHLREVDRKLADLTALRRELKGDR